MIYGIVCFATLFSFVGTVLGGIWADQSWGRFWGWDPKENGALLIVLWNALILHARWGGMVAAARHGGAGRRRQHRHDLVLVRRQHARHRPAQLRLHGRGLFVAVSWIAINLLSIGVGLIPTPWLMAWRPVQPALANGPTPVPPAVMDKMSGGRQRQEDKNPSM